MPAVGFWVGPSLPLLISRRPFHPCLWRNRSASCQRERFHVYLQGGCVHGWSKVRALHASIWAAQRDLNHVISPPLASIRVPSRRTSRAINIADSALKMVMAMISFACPDACVSGAGTVIASHAPCRCHPPWRPTQLCWAKGEIGIASICTGEVGENLNHFICFFQSLSLLN